MKILVEENGHYVEKEVGIIRAATDTVISTATMQPLAGGQAWFIIAAVGIGAYIAGINAPYEPLKFRR